VKAKGFYVLLNKKADRTFVYSPSKLIIQTLMTLIGEKNWYAVIM